jgi:hypothetical protein
MVLARHVALWRHLHESPARAALRQVVRNLSVIVFQIPQHESTDRGHMVCQTQSTALLGLPCMPTIALDGLFDYSKR